MRPPGCGSRPEGKALEHKFRVVLARQSWRAERARERRADAFDCARLCRGGQGAGAIGAQEPSGGSRLPAWAAPARRPARKRRFACAPGRAGRAARADRRAASLARQRFAGRTGGRRDDRRGNDDRRRGGALARSPHIAEPPGPQGGRPARHERPSALTKRRLQQLPSGILA